MLFRKNLKLILVNFSVTFHILCGITLGLYSQLKFIWSHFINYNMKHLAWQKKVKLCNQFLYFKIRNIGTMTFGPGIQQGGIILVKLNILTKKFCFQNTYLRTISLAKYKENRDVGRSGTPPLILL